jgi:hypothetical protein
MLTYLEERPSIPRKRTTNGPVPAGLAQGQAAAKPRWEHSGRKSVFGLNRQNEAKMAQAIEKSKWAAYCERVSEALQGPAEIEVVSLDLGNQVEADWLPLIGISYDPKDDIIDIALQGVGHIIRHPRELRADGEFAELSALEITDKDGVQHLVRLKDILALPAPH